MLKDMVFYGGRQAGSARKRLLEDWPQQNAVIFVVMGAITQGNEIILDSVKFEDGIEVRRTKNNQTEKHGA